MLGIIIAAFASRSTSTLVSLLLLVALLAITGAVGMASLGHPGSRVLRRGLLVFGVLILLRFGWLLTSL